MVTKSHGIHLTSKKISYEIIQVKKLHLFTNRETELPTGEVVDIIYSPNATNSCNSCLRAAGAIFNKDGHLIVTGDTTNEIFRVAYDAALPIISNVYH